MKKNNPIFDEVYKCDGFIECVRLLFHKINRIVSVKIKDDEKCKIFNVSITEIKDRIIEIIEKMYSNSNVLLCARGDSMQLDEYRKFLKKLKNFFVIGKKAKSFFSIDISPEIDHTYNDNHKENLTMVSKLIDKCNTILLKKQHNKPDEIEGQIKKDIIKSLEKCSVEEINKFKLLLLAFLHNNGKDDFFVDKTPFISLAHGEKSIKTAIDFSNNSRNKANEVSIVYLYILNIEEFHGLYFSASDLNEKLGDILVKWYKDIHEEIMLTNAMFPHYLIGYFEIYKNKNDVNFVLNPWFLKTILEMKEYNYEKGVFINQQGFVEFAAKSSYMKNVWHVNYDEKNHNDQLIFKDSEIIPDVTMKF